MDKTSYILDASIGEHGVILFDGSPQTNCRVLCELSKLQAEVARLNGMFISIADHVVSEVNKL